MMLLLWTVLSLTWAYQPDDQFTTFEPNSKLIDRNPDTKLIKDNGALDDIVGFFFSGGGYVSHGEGALLTWGWLEEKSKEALTDLYSNLVVATTSGGGWFFNDLMYVDAWQDVVSAPSSEEFLYRIGEYYYDLIPHVYKNDRDDVVKKTNNGDWRRLNAMDWAVMYTKYSSWTELITTYHYMYPDLPTLGVTDTNWTSTFGLAQHYNDLSIVTNMETIDESQHSSWNDAVPGHVDYHFEGDLQGPDIKVNLPLFDNWYSNICSVRKTNKDCIKNNIFGDDDVLDCMPNAFCDIGLESCVCEHGHMVWTEDGKEICKNCEDEDIVWPAGHPTDMILTWDKWGPRNPTETVTVEKVKQYIFDAINDPKKYSGPSSAAGAVPGSNMNGLQNLFDAVGFEASWTTENLKDVFDDRDAPPLSLIDGGGQDNCALTAAVRKLQEGKKLEEMGEVGGTLVGLCTMEEVMMLISGAGDQQAKLYEIFEFEEGEVAKLQYEGEVMEVWGFKVKTLWEPINGIMHGSHFTIFAHSFPRVQRNWGVPPLFFDSNFGQDPKDYKPIMSLLPGRGEVFELKIAAGAGLRDMEELMQQVRSPPPATGNTPPAPPATGATPPAPQSGSLPGGSSVAAKVHTLDQEYHMKITDTDKSYTKEEEWLKKERRDKQEITMATEGAHIPFIVNLFAAGGAGFIFYGAFKHYTK